MFIHGVSITSLSVAVGILLGEFYMRMRKLKSTIVCDGEKTQVHHFM